MSMFFHLFVRLTVFGSLFRQKVKQGNLHEKDFHFTPVYLENKRHFIFNRQASEIPKLFRKMKKLQISTAALLIVLGINLLVLTVLSVEGEESYGCWTDYEEDKMKNLQFKLFRGDQSQSYPDAKETCESEGATLMTRSSLTDQVTASLRGSMWVAYPLYNCSKWDGHIVKVKDCDSLKPFACLRQKTAIPDHFCPRNLAVEHLTSHSVNLFWFQGSNCPPRPSFEIIYNYSSHHHMFKRIEAAGEENLTKMTTSIDQLLPGTEYLFRVTAEDKTGGVSTLNISCPTASVVVTTDTQKLLGRRPVRSRTYMIIVIIGCIVTLSILLNVCGGLLAYYKLSSNKGPTILGLNRVNLGESSNFR
ncbi:hypothetical protein RRG08_032133 [Elysia crispata]|uniref:Fibronectin type-III domain-containing protein n=1 Tax=Elysia crispata TaxID=231223 RepID=A0AAE1DFF1_9GAST|nr:hypothetical protein RRG08_032133 [Elysia crispata]